MTKTPMSSKLTATSTTATTITTKSSIATGPSTTMTLCCGTFHHVKGYTKTKVVARPGVLTTTQPFYFEGDWAEKIEDKYLLHDGMITDCNIPHPWWTLHSNLFDILPDDRAITHDAVFRLHGVPIFYFPYFYRALKKEPRKSGFLSPEAGHSSQFGYFFGAGYYWAINRSYDLTYVFTDYTERGVRAPSRLPGQAHAEDRLQHHRARRRRPRDAHLAPKLPAPASPARRRPSSATDGPRAAISTTSAPICSARPSPERSTKRFTPAPTPPLTSRRNSAITPSTPLFRATRTSSAPRRAMRLPSASFPSSSSWAAISDCIRPGAVMGLLRYQLRPLPSRGVGRRRQRGHLLSNQPVHSPRRSRAHGRNHLPLGRRQHRSVVHDARNVLRAEPDQPHDRRVRPAQPHRARDQRGFRPSSDRARLSSKDFSRRRAQACDRTAHHLRLRDRR